MISVRLKPKIEEKLNKVVQSKGITKSEYLRAALTETLAKDLDAQKNHWEIGRDLFGRYGGGDPNRSKNRKSLIKEKIRAKASRH